MDADLARVPGVVETTLTAELLARLPDHAPPAPWTAKARGLFWWARPNRAALEAVLPAGVIAGARPVLTIGAMITYTDTPVGPYSEVLALVALRRGAVVFGHVPFIAVDSPASVVGGRANWALPKTLAEFDGTPDEHMTAHAAGWRIEATPHPRGPALPIPLPPNHARGPNRTRRPPLVGPNPWPRPRSVRAGRRPRLFSRRLVPHRTAHRRRLLHAHRTHPTRCSDMNRRMLPVAVVVLVLATPVATWWLVGDRSSDMPPGTDLDYMYRPLPLAPWAELTIGIVSVALAAGSGLLLIVATVRGRFDRRWWSVLVPVLVAGAIVGDGWRVLTAGVIGANIGAGLMVMIGGPIVAGLLVYAGFRYVRLRQSRVS